MIDFPKFSSPKEPRPRKMTLREYALFCEEVAKSNPAITPENCMTNRTDEKDIKVPFSIPARPKCD